jgi:hypothetical protein
LPFANDAPRFYMPIALSLLLRTVKPQASESGAGAIAPDRLYILGQLRLSLSQLRLRLVKQDLHLQALASNVKRL